MAFSLAAVLAGAVRVRGGQAGEQRDGGLASLAAQLVVGPFALLAAGHDAGFAQYFHVVGHGGLAHVQAVDEHAGALLAAAQELQDRKAVGVAQGLEYLGVFLVVCIHAGHLISKFFDMYSIGRGRGNVNGYFGVIFGRGASMPGGHDM